MPVNRHERLPLGERYALRHALAYGVETDAGEIGVVHEVRVPPFEYWPDELIVAAPGGPRRRIPVATVAAVSPRADKLRLVSSPTGAEPVVAPRKSWLSEIGRWRVVAAAGAVLGIAGYAATFVALAVNAELSWGPGLAATGAAGVAASGLAWRKAGRSWLGAVGLGAFWLPLAVGAILSLVWVAG